MFVPVFVRIVRKRSFSAVCRLRSAFRSSFAVTLLFAATALAFGARGAAISGRVIDPQGAGVGNAVVRLYSRGDTWRMSVTADQEGTYRFEHLAPGEYLLDAESEGFARAAAWSVRLERGNIEKVDIPLQLAVIREQVVVTASGTAQPVDEVSKAISVISSAEIDQRDEVTISEALRVIAGLRVQALGGPGALTTIKTRGLRNEDTAVLLDGVRFRDAAAPQGDASGLLEDLIPTNLDRIEVLRGSGSSLYGSNAIGGVVNLVTKGGGGPLRGNLLLEGGGLGLFRGRAQVSGAFLADRMAYSLGASHLNVSSGVSGENTARISSGHGQVSFRLSPATTLSMRLYSTDSFSQVDTDPQAVGHLVASGIVNAVPLSGELFRRYRNGAPVGELNIGNATFIPSTADPDSSRSAHLFSGLVTFAHKPSDRLGYHVIYQGLVTDRRHRNGPAGASLQPEGNTRFDFLGSIHTLNARLNLRLGSFNFVDAGYEFENEKFVNRSFPVDPAENSVVDVTQRSNSLFVQDQMRLLGDQLQLSLAFRLQSFLLSRPRFAPAISVPYQGVSFEAPPNAYTGDGSIAYFFRRSGTKVRGHVGNGYRAPSLFERFGASFGAFGYFIFGDPRLRPDRSIAFDIGLDQALPKSGMRASATYFYTRLQEMIIFDFSGAINPATDPFGRFGGYRNTQGGLARGLELDVGGTLVPWLDLTVAYTYTNSDQRAPSIAGIVHSFAIPNHQFSMVATQHLGRRFFVNFDLVASSGYLAPIFDAETFASRAYRFDGIAKADLGISYRWPLSEFRAIRLYGKVDNVFNRGYYESGFVTPGATAVGGIRFEF
ncbi:MAG: TonB-dependent receptor [Acidobacteria bacterium]|nr:TonB-dependent receptor [Acidobacteriota bacterium]